MVKLHSYRGATHWASFDYELGTFAWKRTGVYRLQGVSECGTIMHFKQRNGQRELWQPISLLNVRGFRPLAFDGGRRK